MGAGWDQVRSRGPQFRSESGVDRIIRYLGGGALPAVLETVALGVHLQDVNVVGEPVKQSAGEPLGCRLSSRRSSLASMSSWTRAAAVVKPTDIPFWQAARPRPRGTWVLPVPLLPTAMTFSLCSMYSHRAS